jgi:multidrug efflux system membrane fusion protein
MRGRLSLNTAALLALLALCACGKPAEEKKDAEKPDSESGVALKPEEIRSLGITTEAAQAASYRAGVSGYGVVVALDTFAQLDADVMTAQAAAAQSLAAANRARSLASGEEAAVSREVVETTRAKAEADQAALMLARRKTEAALGRGAPALSSVRARLASGASVLVRATFPLGALGNEMPRQLEVSRLGGEHQSWAARAIWEAPADPAFPGRGFYVLVDRSDLAQNEHVTVEVPVGAAVTGVKVPGEALVYGQNQAWVYAQTAPGKFARVAVDPGKAMTGGYFLPDSSGIRPGQAVVAKGAGLLLARELNPSTEAEE